MGWFTRPEVNLVQKRTRLILFLTLNALLVVGGLAWQVTPRRTTPEVASPAPPSAKLVRRYAWAGLDPARLTLRSNAALVADQESGEVLYEKDADRVTPMASITKLMTAMVLLDARLPMNAPVTVTQDDVDTLRNSLSHLPVGWTLTREEMLRLALMASENRAASALARTFPGGTEAFVAAMNAKASTLGMGHTRFVDPHGLHAENTSTARDLLLMVNAAYEYSAIRRMTTTPSYTVVSLNSGRSRTFGNSDYLVANDRWVVGLSKTGFINEAGYCLVLQSTIRDRPVVMVFLDSVGKHSRQGDAARVRAWLEAGAGDMALRRRDPDRQHAG